MSSVAFQAVARGMILIKPEQWKMENVLAFCCKRHSSAHNFNCSGSAAKLTMEINLWNALIELFTESSAMDLRATCVEGLLIYPFYLRVELNLLTNLWPSCCQPSWIVKFMQFSPNLFNYFVKWNCCRWYRQVNIGSDDAASKQISRTPGW